MTYYVRKYSSNWSKYNDNQLNLTQHNDIHHKDTQHNGSQYYVTQLNDTQHCEIQHNDTQYNVTRINIIHINTEKMQHSAQWDSMLMQSVITLSVANMTNMLCHYN
jgi:hypothetical protein